MTDEDLVTLRAEWRRQDAGFADVYTRLRRRRWQPHALLALELAGAALGVAIGVWFAIVAARTGSLLLALSAAVMLLAMPLFAVGTVLARKASLRWDEETPEGVLTVSLRRVDASLQAIRVGRWQSSIIVGFVAVLWATQIIGLIHALGFLIFYSAVSAAAIIPYVSWLGRRERHLRGERAACSRMLEDLASEARGSPL